ncbi:MAG: hypothetical protein KFH98_01675 [Gemmatimonadetes bacterium]|nr:hypothetical protein [Gemmatimonadota bacterium]
MLWFLLLFLVAVAFGVWKKFGPIQWIWLLFGTAIVLVILWILMLAFLIGPEMIRTGPPGTREGGL